MSKLRSRLTYANAVSTLCLFMLLGGSAYAAATITGKNIENSSISGKDVKNKSLTQKDIRGPVRGATGPGGVGQITVVASERVLFNGENVQSAVALCPSGSKVVSGGGISISDQQLAASATTEERSGWGVVGIDLISDPGDYVQAQALCAPTGGAVAASDKSQALAEFARLKEKIEAARD